MSRNTNSNNNVKHFEKIKSPENMHEDSTNSTEQK